MADKEKKSNIIPHEDVLHFSDDDSMSIQDAEVSDSEHDLLIRLSQQAQHRRASQNQYHNDINVIGDDSNNDTTTSLDLEVVSSEHDIEDHLDDEIIEEEDDNDDDDDDNSENNEDDYSLYYRHGFQDRDDDFEDSDSLSMMETADFLRQLMQARRNRTAEIHNLSSETAGQSLNEDDEMDDDDNDNINGDGGDDNDENRNEDDEEIEEGEEDEDPRAEFLRVIGLVTGGNRNNSNGDTNSSGNDLVDVMQRLMGGGSVFDGGSARDSGEIDALVNNLSQRQDTYIVLESLNELSERLLMMNGLTAERLIPANKLARSLVEIMEDPKLDEELELHLVACRCLYNFLEVNQDFIHDALNNNAIPALCNKLTEIKYIDLTEQALQTLEMISRDPISHNSIISNNGLSACLQYLDFLTIHAQRKCLTIIANSCSNISITNFPRVKEAFNGIAEVVRNHNDKVVVENAWLTISRIVMCFKNKPDLLNELFADKELLFKELTKVILVSCNKSLNTSSESSQVTLNDGSNLSLITSLIILVSVSVDVSRILISECEIGSVIVKSLNKYAKQNQEIDPLKSHSDSISIEALMSAPKDLISQFLSLIGYLLPITYPPSDALYLGPNYEQDKERQNINQTRIELCTQLIPTDYWKFVNDIWSLLILSFQATMDFDIRRKGFVNLYRIICSNESDFSVIKDVDSIAGLLANVVTQYQSIVIKDFASVEINEDDMVSTDVEESKDVDQGRTSQEDEEEEDDYGEDDDEDEDVVHEDEEFSTLDSRGASSIQSSASSLPEDVNKLNSLMLLLSSLKIIKVLLEKSPLIFIGVFEKEGLINDVLRLLNTLKDKIDLDVKDPRASINLMMSAYSNKFIDSEFTKEYEYKLTSMVIYRNIVNITTDINAIYQQSKDEGLQNLSDSMRILQEVKTSLSNHRTIKSFSYNQWLELWNNLKLVFRGSLSVSSFELISSGVIETLTKLFSSDYGLESNDCYKAFTATFWSDDSATLLVQKLQEALTRTESFDIVSATSGTSNQSSFARDRNQAAIMASQIKLKLTAEGENTDQSKLPGNMQNMILSVHAIATFKSVFAFLKQRFEFFEELGGSLSRSSNNEDSERKQDLNIEFLINGEVIPNETTIYGAIYRSLQEKPDEDVNSSRIWSKVHDVTYRKVSAEVSKESPFTNFNFHYNVDRELSIYDDTTINILKLLKILFRMNNNNNNNSGNGLHNVSTKEFTNWKLTVKLNRQLEEPLVVASGTLPGWSIHLTKQFPFIFPFETRIFFLQSTSFGYSRLIHQWQLRTNHNGDDNSSGVNGNQGNNQRLQLGRPTRHKVRISRKMMLQSAVKVLGMYGSTPGILEIEYFDEEGSGLGPTLEFYSTVSKEFSKKKLRLWRDDEPRQTVSIDDESYVVNKCGLFPRPMDKAQLSSENGRKVLYFYSSLGKFIARALLDSRIIDFNFNPVFLLLIQLLNKTSGISYTSKTSTSKLSKKMATISNLRLVDPTLADSLEHLNKYIQLFEFNSDIHNVTVDGASVEDLALFFELPGNPDYELIPNGSDTLVTADNLELYINKVIEATLFSGILTQTKAFMDGFSKVFPINSLIIFSSRELVGLFGNAEEDWTMDTLTSSIAANHGYTKDSEAIKSLIDILMNFNIEEKREFLQFLTGAPKLPIGGFKALRPELTVVRKHAEDGLKDDDYLPSVMTCANYLKLPNYSSKEVMKEKLIQAMKEGAGAFLLS